MKSGKKFSALQYGEVSTTGGQFVKFRCPPEALEEIRVLLGTKVDWIDIPVTGRVSIAHGGYGRYTRYDITQHKYAGGGHGGGGGYIEVLEIKNPPEKRRGAIIHEWTGIDGSVFSEWENLEDAIAAFEKYWGSANPKEKFPTLPGFRRRVACGELTPWFYAIGDQKLVGDYAFPEGLADDPVYRFGKKFIVTTKDITQIKTCLGTRFMEGQRGYPYYEPYCHRLVYWNDGSVWDESRSDDRLNPPRAAEEGELWISEAVRKFQELLSGKVTEFTINFTNGSKFVGKLLKSNGRSSAPSPAGSYYAIVQIKDEEKPREGWVYDFYPSSGAPDIVLYINKHFSEMGKIIERVEIKKRRKAKEGKKWAGVFLPPPS